MKRQIVLPFSSSLLASDSSNTPGGSERPVCGICRRTFSKYTCPQCNLSYCSLSCYRSEGHSQCTEPFYKRELESEIRAAPSQSSDDKRKMMDLLKRFEEEQTQEDDAADSDEEAEDAPEYDLAKKLEGLDLGNVSSATRSVDSANTSTPLDTADPDMILSMLSESQRTAFLKAVQDPQSEKGQELLASAEIIDNIITPWWDPSKTFDTTTRTRAPVKEPSMMEVSDKVLAGVPAGSTSLLYNIFAVCCAYAYATRTLGISPLATASAPHLKTDAQDLVSRAAPFLSDRRSKLLFTSVDGAWTDFIARLDDASVDLRIVLLRDILTLLRPSPVSQEDAKNPLDRSPSRLIMLALSDLAALFSDTSTRHVAVKHKLAFYAAHANSSGSSDWTAILAVVRKKVEETEVAQASDIDVSMGRLHRYLPSQDGARVVKLS